MIVADGCAGSDYGNILREAFKMAQDGDEGVFIQAMNGVDVIMFPNPEDTKLEKDYKKTILLVGEESYENRIRFEAIQKLRELVSKEEFEKCFEDAYLEVMEGEE